MPFLGDSGLRTLSYRPPLLGIGAGCPEAYIAEQTTWGGDVYEVSDAIQRKSPCNTGQPPAPLAETGCRGGLSETSRLCGGDGEGSQRSRVLGQLLKPDGTGAVQVSRDPPKLC